MKSRFPDAPVLKVLPRAVEAGTYNRVLRLLGRLGSPQELVLGARGLHFRLERELWLCSDCRLKDTPLIAWSRFEPARRAGLHAPVECKVFYYHAFGVVIEGAALNDLGRRATARLAEEQRGAPPPRGARVVAFPARLNDKQ